jgi:hypothetical protein
VRAQSGRTIAIALALACVVTASAFAATTVRVRPAKPFVDDDVTALFKVDRRLPVGWHYEGLLVASSGGRRDCSSIVTNNRSRRRPARGQTMTLRFDPRDDLVRDTSEWCQGKASVSVLKVRNGDEEGGSARPVGTVAFRFYAKP